MCKKKYQCGPVSKEDGSKVLTDCLGVMWKHFVVRLDSDGLHVYGRNAVLQIWSQSSLRPVSYRQGLR